jgi:hypothetical protein
MHVILIFISALAFIFYGLRCLFTGHMRTEFARYRLAGFRKLTGALELLGGSGQLVGLANPSILQFSSAGLALLMFLGVVVRLRTRDPIVQIIPALVLMLLNLWIVVTNRTGH